MSQSHTPQSKFLASLLTSMGVKASNSRHSDFATENATSAKKHTYSLNVLRCRSVPDGKGDVSLSRSQDIFMVYQR